MEEHSATVKTLDARGMVCPKPVTEAKKALKDMREGSLKVLVDNPMAVENLKKLAGYLGMPVIAESGETGVYSVIFQAGDRFPGKESHSDKNVSDRPAETEKETVGRKPGMLVVVSSDRMGDGDEALGRVLIKGFLYALTQLEELPETLLFYNGGVKLTTEGSDSLEDLRWLESQGVRIMTCGTCLNHYGLSEKLRAGSVTNMYAIAETMAAASVMIKP